jgi:hypothetical protein
MESGDAWHLHFNRRRRRFTAIVVCIRTLLTMNRVFIFGLLTFVGFSSFSSVSFSQRNRAQKVYYKVEGAVFSVHTYHKDGSRHGQASGVVLKSRGWLVTNFHVMGDAKTFKASHYGKKLKLDTLVRADKKNDILIIAIDKDWDPEFYEQIPDIDVADISQVHIGQDIYAIGNPLGYENTITNGIVSGIRSSSDSLRQFIQISAPFSPGSSGGAAVNDKGELVGITTFKESNVQGLYIGFAIPVDQVLNFDIAGAKKDLKMEKQPDKLFQTGWREYESGHYREALSYLTSAKFPGENEEYFADYLIARCYEELGLTDSAMVHFLSAINRNPGYGDSYLGVARLYRKLGDMDKAWEYQQQAYSVDPSLREREPE